MKRAVLALVLSLGVTSSVSGNVIFDGPTDVVQGTTALFEVSLAPQTLGDIQAADILLWSMTTPFSFAYSGAWTSAMANVSPVTPAGIFPFDIFVSGNNPSGPIGSTSIVLGTVSIDTTSLALNSSHTVGVDFSQDFFSQILLGAFGEPAVGSGTFRVVSDAVAVSEPTTFALFGVGLAMLGLMMRRRKSA
jgi:hypothetical protein